MYEHEHDIVISFLTGKTDIQIFTALLRISPLLRNYISSLVPKDAVNNENHPYWKNISYSVMKADDFDGWKQICRIVRFDGSLGDNLNLWDSLSTLIRYYDPDIQFTNYYEESFQLYLDAEQDSFEGSEVRDLVNSIVTECLSIKPKTKRIKTAKQRIKEAFHISGRERPYWIQGPDWPMGENSPMKFIGRKRYDEEVHYFFEDVDTGEIRTVIQYYYF